MALQIHGKILNAIPHGRKQIACNKKNYI
ncbi:BnaC01g32110D [Brassica napus]|uniref:BnaC01g32110D protein n=1 Tax=Brassica napus TaxID=3708 RepID=A0A078G1C4_BRANA|nr:BnaC01g32110D [Brassica napus]